MLGPNLTVLQYLFGLIVIQTIIFPLLTLLGGVACAAQGTF